MHIPKVNFKVTRRNIRVRGLEYYNGIPIEVREVKSVKSFRNRLKRAKIFKDTVSLKGKHHCTEKHRTQMA